ncbi:peptidylprolyl isomerase, partial [Candidatus Woesearchaeota archaeon]|nr:peptidylprolyl isomerase [Candidatus Woesearchaeota archaeon]
MATRVNASHILVRTEEQAKQVLEQINNGKNFETLAKEVSICPSRKKGGSLGWFSHGQMVKEFQKVAFKMKKGQISQPVKT